MAELAQDNDMLVLFSPKLDNESVLEIVKWQNTLGIPVLAQLESHVRAGALAGMVVDFKKVAPKLAEYIDKLFKGRITAQLPPYYYSGKLLINLRAAKILHRHIPAEVTAQAGIIH